MPWHAKPDYGYTISSTEGHDNILMMNGQLNAAGYELAAQAALIAVSCNEGSLNPWLWQYGTTPMVGEYTGYGLFQYTPFDKYIDNPTAMALPGYGPNRSRTSITVGALETDGWAQMAFMIEGYAGWFPDIWRWGAWDETEFPVEYAAYQGLISRWGVNGEVTQDIFKTITNIEDAVIAFMGGYEGSANPGYYSNAVSLARNDVWPILSGDTPPSPPGPPTLTRKGMPIWMYLI